MQQILKEKNILLITANLELSFGILRILNKMKIKPYILGPNARSFLLRKKIFFKKYISYNAKKMGYDYSPTISSFSEKFILLLNQVCSENQIDVVLPIDFTVILPLSRYSDKLDENINIAPFLSEEKLRFLNNKWNFANLMDDLEIPQPKTRLLNKRELLSELDISFPIIIKPLDRAGGFGIHVFQKKNDLISYLDNAKLDLTKTPLLIQKYLPGKDLQVFVFATKGKLQAWSMCFMENRGFRSFVKIPEVMKYCEKIVSEFKYNGPGLFDIRNAAEDNSFNFLEMNLRFPASTLYHFSAGVNYVELSLLAGLGMIEEFSFRATKSRKVGKSLWDTFLFKIIEKTTPQPFT